MREVKLKLFHVFPLLGLFNAIKNPVYHKSEKLHQKTMLYKKFIMNVQGFSTWVSLLIEIHVTISCLHMNTVYLQT